jgi:hypothetical protein
LVFCTKKNLATLLLDLLDLPQFSLI